MIAATGWILAVSVGAWLLRIRSLLAWRMELVARADPALGSSVAEALAQNRDPVAKVLETAQTLGKAVRSARASGAT